MIFDIVLNSENLYSIGAVEEEMQVAMTYYRSLGMDSEIVNISPSAQIGKGCLICAGAVVNHAAICGDCVQVDCNAVVPGNTVAQSGVKVNAGMVYEKKMPHCPVSVDGSEFRFEDGM